MDCPNCGVYNPEERTVCWRCDQELPKPKEPKTKRGLGGTTGRMWAIIVIAILIWLAITFLLPLLLKGGMSLP